MADRTGRESDAEMLAWFEKRCQWYQGEIQWLLNTIQDGMKALAPINLGLRAQIEQRIDKIHRLGDKDYHYDIEEQAAMNELRWVLARIVANEGQILKDDTVTAIAVAPGLREQISELLIQKKMICDFYTKNDDDSYECLYCDERADRLADIRHLAKCNVSKLLVLLAHPAATYEPVASTAKPAAKETP